MESPDRCTPLWSLDLVASDTAPRPAKYACVVWRRLGGSSGDDGQPQSEGPPARKGAGFKGRLTSVLGWR